MFLGFHVSIQGSIDRAVDRAHSLGCTTFQVFTTNPRGWYSRGLQAEEIEKFLEKRSEYGFSKVFSHMPYLPNLASPRPEVYHKSVETLLNEIKRCRLLKIPFLVTHLGSHLGQGFENGAVRIRNALNDALSIAEGEVTILLENTAGSAYSLGSTFEQIEYIFRGISDSSGIGVCMDTCHAWAAGYDIKTEEGLKKTISEIEKYIGFGRIFLVHLNDSVGVLGSHIDRHEHIGLGSIGLGGFRNFLKSPFGSLPLIMETPVDDRRSDVENMRVVREMLSGM